MDASDDMDPMAVSAIDYGKGWKSWCDADPMHVSGLGFGKGRETGKAQARAKKARHSAKGYGKSYGKPSKFEEHTQKVSPPISASLLAEARTTPTPAT